jgi:hypothetical protein
MRFTTPSRLFYLAFIVMELSYLYLIASLLGGPWYSLAVMLLLHPLAFFSRVILPQAVLSRRLRITLELILVVLIILLVTGERLLSSLSTGRADISGMFFQLAFCVFTWFLGHNVPHSQIKFTTIAFRLQIGLLAVLIFSQIAGSAPPVFIFFLMTPLVLFLARWANSCSREAIVLKPPNAGHIVLSAASIIVPGTALILIFSPNIARSIVKWLGNVTTGISDWLMAQHEAANNPSGGFNLDFSCMRPLMEEAPPPSSGSLGPVEGTGGISPAAIWTILSVIFLVIVVLVVLAIIRRKRKRKARPTTQPVPFQIRMVSLNTLLSLIALLPRLIKKLWLWIKLLFRKWKERPGSTEEPLISIRALYRNLLRWAAKKGVSRAPSETPLEHLELMVQKFPEQKDGLKQITEAYLLARYGRRAVSDEEFDRVKKVWQRTAGHHTRL